MTSDLSLEQGASEAGSICECCATRSITVHGFIYEAGDAFAIYYAGWTPGHADRGVTLAVATGAWGEGSGPADRVSIGLRARSTDSEIQFTVLDPRDSPWAETSLFGRMLHRDDALGHPRLATTFKVAELVVREDARIRAILQ